MYVPLTRTRMGMTAVLIPTMVRWRADDATRYTTKVKQIAKT